MINYLVTLVMLVFTNIYQNNKSLTINILNITNEHVGKNIYVGLWDTSKEDFPTMKKVDIPHMQAIESKEVSITKNLKGNMYAVSVFIDMNNNGKLDTNMFGAPKEPYCFSNNLAPKFSAPSFKECSFLLDENKEINLKMLD